MTWVFSLIGVGSFVSLGSWRRGMLFLLVVGFLQDPIRKMLPGFPVYMQVMVLGFLGIIVLCAVLQNVQFRLSYLYGDDHRLRQAWLLFIFLIVLQCVHTFVRHGNPILAGLGVINYLAPVAVMVFGITFARDADWIRRFIRVYLYLAVPFALTVYLSLHYQDQWDLLKSIGRLTGQPLLIYDQGTVLYSNSGLMRTGEVAAWHAGTAVMLLTMLAALDKRFGFRLFVGIVAALLIGVVILTGRRKMLMAIAIFLGMFLLISMFYWHGRTKLGAMIAVVAIGSAAYLWFQSESTVVSVYEARGASVLGDAWERLMKAWDLAESGFRRGGLVGLGAGVSAQGSQHFGGGVRIAGGAAEAGGGKLLVELGVVGLVAVAYLLWRIVCHFHELMQDVSADNDQLKVFMAGGAALLIANGVTFVVATQIFGDSFILLLMGVFLGFLFAIGRRGTGRPLG